ncbi:MAG: hypothetical protein EPO10_16700 [Reyranella sp.]|uniref:hypothetical protein n=1 Tax=Reyranella sp. TaxID=1929291 RepID=UPI0011F86856|nr:hypothetical protein [Reyranella sp.]TAJ91234.1 MAG: hypothetical protein EPO41_15235 [Reyranella sp.]TBR27722.1 MAG: hypothetical protein EPO10_16700 [Reyranella sp.]
MTLSELSVPQQIIVRRLALGLSLSGLGVRQDFSQLARLGLVTGNRDYPQLTDEGFACLHAIPFEEAAGPIVRR